MRQATEVPAERSPSWALFACALLFAGAAGIGLIYLLWSYVPHHAQHFAEVGTALPLSTRLGIASANWFVRLFPLLVLLGLPAIGVVIVILVVASQRLSSYRMIKAATLGILLVALGEVAASAFVIYAMCAAY